MDANGSIVNLENQLVLRPKVKKKLSFFFVFLAATDINERAHSQEQMTLMYKSPTPPTQNSKINLEKFCVGVVGLLCVNAISFQGEGVGLLHWCHLQPRSVHVRKKCPLSRVSPQTLDTIFPAQTSLLVNNLYNLVGWSLRPD